MNQFKQKVLNWLKENNVDITGKRVSSLSQAVRL